MPRYINADELAIKFRMLAEDPWNKDTVTTWSNAYEECADNVDEFTTADVVERKKGKWEVYGQYKQTIDGRTFDGWCECSNCRMMYRYEFHFFCFLYI